MVVAKNVTASLDVGSWATARNVHALVIELLVPVEGEFFLVDLGLDDVFLLVLPRSSRIP